ncbi:MAG TPA: amidohydrolase family protein [Bryobacteraceae bacterium]|nr:amidohydrolase family protein [Bryobacteraceae bacterium]
MLTRRAALQALSGAFAKTARRITPVEFAVPADACDCHTHIIGDPRQFPFSPARVYTPETASPQEMTALHRALHIKRVVIVTPSVYGTDNSATIYGIKTRGATARGVAVIDEKTSEGDLDSMAAAGIRGIRLNLAIGGQADLPVARQRFSSAVNRIKSRNWHLQIYTNAALIAGIKDLVLASPVPVVFDHFGGIQTSLGPEQPGFAELVDLLRYGNAYVKISGAYRASTQAPDYADVAPYAKGLILANPERVLWGTDWPHPNSAPSKDPTKVTPPLAIDDGRLFNQFAIWAPDPQIRRKILVDNPARLYGF